MAESSRGKVSVGRIKKDKISEMPSDIRESILCLLPIRDAVRTSVLSTNWRFSWTMIPQLIFDQESLGSINYKFSSRDRMNTYEQYRQCKTDNAHEFVSVISKVLQLHNGPILKFSLGVPNNCDAQIISDHIAQWISLFSRKGVKQLILDRNGYDGGTGHDFSSLDLTHLSLTEVSFPSTSRLEFTYLTNLELVQATCFRQSIFNCPVLQKLTLLHCEGLSIINFHAPNLKCIYEISEEITLSWLENLTEYCFGLCTFCWPTDTKTSNLVKVLGSLHKIEKFSIGIYFIRFLAEGGCPDRLPGAMPCLKSLDIFQINFTHMSEIFCLLCLIQSAPNLRKLHVSACIAKDAVEGNFKNFWGMISEDCTLDQLEIVTFSDLRGLETELELVKFILAHSPLLKTMCIHYSRDVAAPMKEEMLQYSRTSSRAQIIHLEESPANFFGSSRLFL